MERRPPRSGGLILLLLPGLVSAGAVIETTGTDRQASTIYVSDTNVRVESAASGARGASVTLFDAEAEELIFIDHTRRRYQRVGQEQLRKIAERMEAAREEMQRRLRDLPEEHREQMRQDMQTMLPGGDASDIRVERGDSGIIAGIACQEALVHIDGEPSHAVCVAAPETLGLSQSAYQTLDRMFAFFGEMTAGLSEGRGALGPRTTSHVMDVLEGVPVRSKAISGGASWSVSTVRNTTIAPARFRVPDGYSEVDPMAER